MRQGLANERAAITASLRHADLQYVRLTIPLQTVMEREKMHTPLMKIGISLLVVVSLSVCAFDFAVAQNKRDTVSSKVLALETKWNEAYKRGDIATMESLLADDFVITVEDGSTFSKSGYIAHNGDSTVHVEISEMSDLRVRIHGNTVVVTGAYHEKGISKGKRYESHDRLTDVWMNIGGTWQVIASHYSIPASQ
jgi:ketosteroid isomerase-like protein